MSNNADRPGTSSTRPGPGPGPKAPPPRTAPLSPREEVTGASACCDYFLTVLCWIFLVCTFPITLCFSIKFVNEYERAVIFRWGRLKSGQATGPGVFLVLPFADNYTNIDMRTVSFDVPPQEILTKDSVTARVDAVVYYRVEDPLLAIVKVQNFSNSTRILAQSTLRNILGTKTLAEVLSDRDIITHTMQVVLDQATDPWGVKVERVEITDVKLPQSLQRAMAAEAEAGREARAKVVAAEGEMKAARSLKEAAQVLLESPASLQLRYLQTLTTVAAEKNKTIAFPLPIELITPFMGRR